MKNPASAGVPPVGRRQLLSIVGPGLVVAATGVGAGDLVSAGKAGATFGLTVLGAAVVGSLLRFSLAEGLARWQLATGLVMNNRRDLGALRNGWASNVSLVSCLILFGILGGYEILGRLR